MTNNKIYVAGGEDDPKEIVKKEIVEYLIILIEMVKNCESVAFEARPLVDFFSDRPNLLKDILKAKTWEYTITITEKDNE